MNDIAAYVATAIWVGILTSVSPCPLATNIAAVSFVSKRVDSPILVWVGGALYALGRALTYVALVSLTVSAVAKAPSLSHFLQKYMNQVLGPVLIAVGLVLLDILPLRLNFSSGQTSWQKHIETLGICAAFPLGVIFALSLCPTSAALFFGTILPLAIKKESVFLIPTLYGIGTALPVVAFAVIIALGARSLGRCFDFVTSIEKRARETTAIVFIGIGANLSLNTIFGISLF